jgi:hypothetical protein
LIKQQLEYGETEMAYLAKLAFAYSETVTIRAKTILIDQNSESFIQTDREKFETVRELSKGELLSVEFSIPYANLRNLTDSFHYQTTLIDSDNREVFKWDSPPYTLTLNPQNIPQSLPETDTRIVAGSQLFVIESIQQKPGVSELEKYPKNGVLWVINATLYNYSVEEICYRTSHFTMLTEKGEIPLLRDFSEWVIQQYYPRLEFIREDVVDRMRKGDFCIPKLSPRSLILVFNTTSELSAFTFKFSPPNKLPLRETAFLIQAGKGADYEFVTQALLKGGKVGDYARVVEIGKPFIETRLSEQKSYDNCGTDDATNHSIGSNTEYANERSVKLNFNAGIGASVGSKGVSGLLLQLLIGQIDIGASIDFKLSEDNTAISVQRSSEQTLFIVRGRSLKLLKKTITTTQRKGQLEITDPRTLRVIRYPYEITEIETRYTVVDGVCQR